MKTGCLSIVRNALLVAAAVGIVVSALGWLMGWRTPVRFSDGLFWAGALVMAAGLMMMIGGQGVRASPGILYSESASERLSERTRRWVVGLSEDYGTIILILLAGGALFGLSVIVDALGGSS